MFNLRKKQIIIPLDVSLKTLLDKSLLLIEEEDFEKASVYLDFILEREPFNGRAYFARLLVDHRAKNEVQLSYIYPSFSSELNWQRFLKYALPEERVRIQSLMDSAFQVRLTTIYEDACNYNISDIDSVRESLEKFKLIEGYADSHEKISQLAPIYFELQKKIKEQD